MQKKALKQFAIYSRKSKFTGKGESVENQVEICRRYIADHFGQEEAENALVYEDEGFSGGNLERPRFKKMMKDSHNTKFDAIVVYRLDRISRNIGDFAKLIEDLNDREIEFVSVRESFETTSPMGKAMMYIASIFSQLERETIAERIRDNLVELAKTGRWLGGNTPTGYASEAAVKVTVDGKEKRAYHLKLVPEEIGLVKLIFEKFLEMGSLTKVEQLLLEKRYTTKLGNDFSRFAIRGILTNPVYMIADQAAFDYLKENKVELFAEQSDFDGEHGIMAYNRTIQKSGRAQKMKPMEEWIVSVGRHPGVISGENWVRVQAMLERNKSKSYRTPRSNEALLTGLVFCGNCGERMRPKLTDRTGADGQRIYTYMCSTKERSTSTRCNVKNLSGNLLDAKIISEIQKLAENPEFFAQFLSQTKKEINGNQGGYEGEIASLKSQLAEKEKGIENLIASLAKAGSSSAAPYIMKQIEGMHEDVAALKQRLDELEELTSQHQLADQEFALFQQMVASFARSIQGSTVEEKRRLLRAIVRKVVWDGQNVSVYLFAGDGELDFGGIDASDASGVPWGGDCE